MTKTFRKSALLEGRRRSVAGPSQVLHRGNALLQVGGAWDAQSGLATRSLSLIASDDGVQRAFGEPAH